MFRPGQGSLRVSSSPSKVVVLESMEFDRPHAPGCSSLKYLVGRYPHPVPVQRTKGLVPRLLWMTSTLFSSFSSSPVTAENGWTPRSDTLSPSGLLSFKGLSESLFSSQI